MATVLIIGAGGVGRVVAYKCAQNSNSFERVVLASKTLKKCEDIQHFILQKQNKKIEIDQVDANKEKELIKLPGVGRKTAHVIMIEYFKKNLMAVDTHVFRVSHRLRMSDAKTISQTQKDLQNLLKEDFKDSI